MTPRTLTCLLALLCAAGTVHASGFAAPIAEATPFVVDGLVGVEAVNAAEPMLSEAAGGAGTTDTTCLSPWIEAGATSPAAPIDAGVQALAAAQDAGQARPAARPMAVEYSDGYNMRLKVHKYASFATLPLFVAQYAVGQKLYNGNGSDSTRSLHNGLAVGTGALFVLNTVTGVMNYAEARKDPNGGKRRKLHGLLMAIADVGFVTTGVTAPNREFERENGGFQAASSSNNQSRHRALAIGSMGVATAGYLLMLLGH